jgi:hypothetical protein
MGRSLSLQYSETNLDRMHFTHFNAFIPPYFQMINININSTTVILRQKYTHGS